MAARASRRARLLGARMAPAALGAVLTVVVAACSSSAPAEITSAPAVTPNGKHYAYAAGSVETSQWPKVCTLLTQESAAAVIGTAVTLKSFHHRCFYIPGNDAFATLTVTILGIGSDNEGIFDQARDDNEQFRPETVAGVGSRAVFYPVSGSPTFNLDLLTRQGVFEIAVRSPVGNELSAADARARLVKVGRVLNEEFAG